jgi:transcription termination/antitermination protein NusG
MLDFDRLNHRWLAVQVRSGWEIKTAIGLRERGYEELVPTYEQKRKRSDRTVTLHVPLFTGYVFLRFQADNRQPIISVPGVIRFVGMANSPSPIEDSEIDALRITSKAAGRCGPWPFLEVGEEVEIQKGPLSGLKGKVVRFENRQRLIINVNLLMKSAFVEIEDHEVAPVNPPRKEMGAVVSRKNRGSTCNAAVSSWIA